MRMRQRGIKHNGFAEKFFRLLRLLRGEHFSQRSEFVSFGALLYTLLEDRDGVLAIAVLFEIVSQAKEGPGIWFGLRFAVRNRPAIKLKGGTVQAKRLRAQTQIGGGFVIAGIEQECLPQPYGRLIRQVRIVKEPP